MDNYKKDRLCFPFLDKVSAVTGVWGGTAATVHTHITSPASQTDFFFL